MSMIRIIRVHSYSHTENLLLPTVRQDNWDNHYSFSLDLVLEPEGLITTCLSPVINMRTSGIFHSEHFWLKYRINNKNKIRVEVDKY